MAQDERLQENQNIHILSYHCQNCGLRVLYYQKDVL